MILSCQNISKAFIENKVLQNVSFHIEDYEKAAIVGINGAGKTTLLRILIGEMEADSGVVAFSKDKTFGYLAQNAAVDSDRTIYDELLSVKQELIDLEEKMRTCEQNMKHAQGEELENLMKQYTLFTHQFEIGNGYAYQSELIGVLKGLGFEEAEFTKPVATLSGGQKTRVALGRLLLLKPDLIILDEPTNHLDMNSIAWLETYLLNYKGAVLIVSHDRYFLDRIAGKIIEIDQTKATVFTGNYTDYVAKKELLKVAAMNAYENQQREIKHQEEVIAKLKSFNREKSIRRAESREKMLNKIEVLDKPTEARADMRLKLTPRFVSGNDVLTVTDLSKSYGNRRLFQHVNFEIKRGEHVAIIGDNGTGKTTLLKVLNELVTPDTGFFELGTNVEIGYYDQEHHVLHSEKTLFEEISDAYPNLTNTEIRNVLAAFLFVGDDVFKLIRDLSGGERGRVSLAKLMLSNSNFLILDEPTNHLDIISKEILENALNNYEGTILYVSHDRYFINKTATRILDLTANQLFNYIGNYDYYLEKHDAVMAAAASLTGSTAGHTAFPGNAANRTTPANTANHTTAQGNTANHTTAQGNSANHSIAQGNSANRTTTSGNAASGSAAGGSAYRSTATGSTGQGMTDWKAQKEAQARIRKLENDLKKCEDRISKLEERNNWLDTEMSKPEIATNSVKLQELASEQEKNNQELEGLYDVWAELSEAL